jgi:hypothetical protein
MYRNISYHNIYHINIQEDLNLQQNRCQTRRPHTAVDFSEVQR